MDPKVLQKLTYGLFILTARTGDFDNGCIINTAIQVASSPDRVAISVSKANFTNEMLHETDDFTLSFLAEDAPFALFERFGFRSGRDGSKFDGFDACTRVSNGTLAVTQGTNAYLCCKIEKRVELNSHTLFIAEIKDGAPLSDIPSASYGFYHTHIKPRPAETPKTAKTVWRCAVCGYEYEGEELPENFVCPICKHGKEEFEKSQPTENNILLTKENPTMKKWKCLICGEIVESETRPDKCPLCKAPGEKFVELKEDEMTWASEHVVGVAKDVPEEIKEGLRANFNGECCEVGMYLAMGRVAAREGYPEIAMYWEKAAFEEAEHAAKFAELLGEVLTDSTKKNLEMRVAAENGATAGKTELAKLAKQANLDAIHDTVHEMARDEARHGKAFAGLLKRYFGE